MINDLRQYMRSSPLGISYSSSEQGEAVDAELKTALQKLEIKIGLIIGNPVTKGTIISMGGKILTTLDDIKKSVSIVGGFNKNAQATVETLDATLEDTEIPVAGKQMLSNDEAASQFQGASTWDSQQIGKSQIDPIVGDKKVCPKCQGQVVYDQNMSPIMCKECGGKGFKVPAFDNSQDRFIAIASLLKNIG